MPGLDVGTAAELVRSSVSAFNERDVPALLRTFDDDVELVPFAAKVNGESFRGAEGVRRWLTELSEEWSEWTVHLDGLQTFGERVLTTGSIAVRARETGIEADVPASWVTTVREGVIVRLESYGDEAEARIAASRA